MYCKKKKNESVSCRSFSLLSLTSPLRYKEKVQIDHTEVQLTDPLPFISCLLLLPDFLFLLIYFMSPCLRTYGGGYR